MVTIEEMEAEFAVKNGLHLISEDLMKEKEKLQEENKKKDE